MVENEISIRNLISFSADIIDHASAETQYTKFKVIQEIGVIKYIVKMNNNLFLYF